MTPAWPRYLLFADTIESERQLGWRFVLSAIDSPHTIAAEDYEAETARAEGRLERLELMAALRGLEALDQPSLVTLICPSRYVRRGFERGLKQWREGGWKWECFGRRVWVRDHDLWRRIDHALKFHRVDCRSWRFESSDPPAATPAPQATLTRLLGPKQQQSDWSASRLNSDPALLVVSPPRRARRGVFRFDTEPAVESEPTTVAPEMAAAG